MLQKYLDTVIQTPVNVNNMWNIITNPKITVMSKITNFLEIYISF